MSNDRPVIEFPTVEPGKLFTGQHRVNAAACVLADRHVETRILLNRLLDHLSDRKSEDRP
jgi:hypothetical protein